MKSAPFLHTDTDNRTIMIETLIALCPALLWAVYRSGTRAAVLCLFSMLFATFLDLLYEVILRCVILRKSFTFDSAAPLMGLLIAFAMPANVSLWVILTADFLAVIVLRRLLGSALAPVAAACALLMLITKSYQRPFALADGVYVQTSLDDLITGNSPDLTTFDLILGRGNGGIGEIAGLLLILGGLYLLIRRHIQWEIPVAAMVAAGFLAMELAPDTVAYYPYMGDQLFSGGLILGVFFIASDPAKVPISTLGRLIYGALIGVFTLLSRIFFSFDGVYLAIAILSLFVPLIDRLTLPAMFGGNPRRDRNLSKEN